MTVSLRCVFAVVVVVVVVVLVVVVLLIISPFVPSLIVSRSSSLPYRP